MWKNGINSRKIIEVRGRINYEEERIWVKTRYNKEEIGL